MADKLEDAITSDLNLSSNNNEKIFSDVLKNDKKDLENGDFNNGNGENSRVEESLTIEDELQQKDSENEDKQQGSSKDVTHGKKPLNCCCMHFKIIF